MKRRKAEIAGNRLRMIEGVKAREAAGAVPDDLLRTLRGYQESRVLLTALELDVFTAVGAGATAEAVAAERRLDHRGTTLLLNALVALGMLTKKEGVFANSPLAARYLAAGSKDDARDALRHNVSLWSRWSTLTAAVRAGRSVAQDVAADESGWTVPFIAAMHRNAALRAPLVEKAVGARRVKRLLDVGGGSGAYSIAFAQANPELRAEILDVASVVPIAERHIHEAGLGDRVRARAGDLREGELGEGHDLVLLSMICHMLRPEENQDLLRRARSALVSGGRVVLQDFILGPDGTAPAHAALFSLNMLVGTEGGQSYSEQEYVTWLGQAGFVDAHVVKLGGPSDLVIATRPD
jgi:hypothetical protein